MITLPRLRYVCLIWPVSDDIHHVRKSLGKAGLWFTKTKIQMIMQGSSPHVRTLSSPFRYLTLVPARRRDKGKHLPPDLRALWEKDRQKKAEFKKQRELAKLLTASDPLAKKKGGRKGKKAMLLAASMDPTIKVLPNRIMDMTTLVQQIRRFIDNIGGPNTMSLPPSSKETRKQMHEIALAFGLKSVSKGKGEARYTTLTKTTRSVPGGWVDEKKIGRVVRRSAAGGGLSFVLYGLSYYSVYRSRTCNPQTCGRRI